MRPLLLGLITAVFLTFAAPAAFAIQTPDGILVGDTDKGETLVNADRMSLYIFSEDQPGESLCIGGCATNWPPQIAQDGAKPTGDFTLVKRPDGKMQWAYKGKPLYAWVEDEKPGDTTGDGFGGKWYLAKP